MGTMTETTTAARARVVHLMACAGAPYADLRHLADDDPSIVAAAMSYRSDDRLDYSVMPRVTVVFRLEGLLRQLARRAA